MTTGTKIDLTKSLDGYRARLGEFRLIELPTSRYPAPEKRPTILRQPVEPPDSPAFRPLDPGLNDITGGLQVVET